MLSNIVFNKSFKLMIFTAMRRLKNLFILSSLLMLVWGMSGCSDFDNGYTDKDIAYKEQFLNMFGNADPNHTWNMAEVCSLDVTINMEGTYTVKVWTANPRSSENNAYLLGQYDHVAGGTSNIFGCDIPATVETAYVGIVSENGDRIIESAKVKDGKVSVTFGTLGTRAVFSSNNGVVSVSDAGKSKEFQKGDLDIPLTTLPEGVSNIDKVQDFEYVSTGEFVIYPIYTITSNAGSDGRGQRLGIYLCDGNGNKTGDVVWIWQSTVNDYGATGSATWFDAYNSSTGQWESDLFAFNHYRNLKGWENGNAVSRVDNPKTVWDDVASNFISPYTAIRPEGIRVNIPVGTRFGMVLDAADGGPYYSNSQYNNDDGWPFQGQTGTDGVKDVYGATFKNGNDLYLAFEDWKYGGSDCDFNDIVFIMPQGNKLPLIIDKDTEDVSMSYIVACEDLGGTFDWDFNDVVYAIEHVSGQTTARLKLLAAGGTLPVKISYKDQIIKFNDQEDLHEAFSVDLNTPVNVGGYSANPLYSEEFTVDANAFSMSTHASDFKIHVDYTDGSQGSVIGLPDRDGTVKEPQAFLVADPNWQWPLEEVCITNLYPEFSTWITSLQDGKNWCGSVWGGDEDVINATGSIHDIISYNAVQYSGNVATFLLDANQMAAYTAYLVVLETSADATVEFYASNGEKITLKDGNVKAGERTIFTLSGEALNALKGGRMTITFPDGQNAQGRVTSLLWVESGNRTDGSQVEKVEPGLSVNPSSLTFAVGDSQQRIEVTSNSSGTITYKSSNSGVATVDAYGNVVPVAAGTAHIAVTQAETDTYNSATEYVAVTVSASSANLQDPGLGLSSQLSFNAGYRSQTENISTNSDGAIAVTCSDESVVNVVLNGKQMQITALKAGTATITVRQEATSTYAAAEKAMMVTVQASDPNLNINDNLSWDATNNKTNSLSFSTQSNGTVTLENNSDVVEAVVNGTNITFTALKAGTATITVKQAASAFYAEAVKTITVTVSGSFGDENAGGNGNNQDGSTELTGTLLTVTKATDTPKNNNVEVPGTWYKLSAAEMYEAVGNNDGNGVVLEIKLHNSGITSFYMGNNENCTMFTLKDGNSDTFHSVSVWGLNVVVQWNGEWNEVNGIPARTLIVTIPDNGLWRNGVVSFYNNTYNKDLYFGGNAGNQDATIQATIRPNN